LVSFESLVSKETMEEKILEDEEEEVAIEGERMENE
jgi:hypothetical protein